MTIRNNLAATSDDEPAALGSIMSQGGRKERPAKAMTTAQEAFARLSALCARSEHCQHDMLEKMRQWGMDAESQAQVMGKLTNGHYVDDERFARAFVSDKIRYAKWGRRKIEQALRMKHIDEGIAGDVLGTVDDEDYLDVLRPLIRQKLKCTRAASDYELHMKVTKYALGRGFTSDLIRQCLDTVYDNDTDTLSGIDDAE